MRAYLKLFLTFAYIGAFTFGGGYAMLPMFHRELTVKKDWLTEAEVTDLFSISQCLPGIIATNTAVFVGHKQKGALGSIMAVLGVAFPSVVFILILAAFFSFYADIPAVSKAFVGLRVCVCVLILNAVVKLWKNSIADKLSIIVFVVVFLVSVLTSLPVALIVAASGVTGIAVSALRKRLRKGDAG